MRTLTPQQWVAAASMAYRRGERVQVIPTTVQAYVLALPDGTALAYRNDPQPRAFRSEEQAKATLATFDLAGPPPTAT